MGSTASAEDNTPVSVGKELCSVAIRGAHTRAQEEASLREAFKTFDRDARRH